MGFGLIGLVLMLLFWGGLIALAIWLVRALFSGSQQSPHIPEGRGMNAREILDQRYARGEIGPEQIRTHEARPALTSKRPTTVYGKVNAACNSVSIFSPSCSPNPLHNTSPSGLSNTKLGWPGSPKARKAHCPSEVFALIGRNSIWSRYLSSNPFTTGSIACQGAQPSV